MGSASTPRRRGPQSHRLRRLHRSRALPGLDAIGGNTVHYTANGVAYQWDDVNAASTSTGTAQTAVKTPHSQAALFASPAFQAGSFTPVAAVIASRLLRPCFLRQIGVQYSLAASPLSRQLNHVDGGGSEGLPTDNAATADVPAVLAPTPLTPANLSGVPLFGPLLKEATGPMKAVRSMMPSGLWQTAEPVRITAPRRPSRRRRRRARRRSRAG